MEFYLLLLKKCEETLASLTLSLALWDLSFTWVWLQVINDIIIIWYFRCSRCDTSFSLYASKNNFSVVPYPQLCKPLFNNTFWQLLHISTFKICSWFLLGILLHLLSSLGWNFCRYPLKKDCVVHIDNHVLPIRCDCGLHNY